LPAVGTFAFILDVDVIGLIDRKALRGIAGLGGIAQAGKDVASFVSKDSWRLFLDGFLDDERFGRQEDHGEQCEQPGRPYLRAVRMAPDVDLLDFASGFASATGLLLDAFVEGYGGGGKAFDWSQIPPGVPLPVVLSGGLNPANVIDGVMRVRPWAVDVSSGVEQDKGIKDAVLIRRFCEAVREADARIANAMT
jgi:hypothetical protein